MQSESKISVVKLALVDDVREPERRPDARWRGWAKKGFIAALFEMHRRARENEIEPKVMFDIVEPLLAWSGTLFREK